MTEPLSDVEVVRAALRRLNPEFYELDPSWASLNRLTRNGDPDYSPDYQDEYQRLWHEAAARATAPVSRGRPGATRGRYLSLFPLRRHLCDRNNTLGESAVAGIVVEGDTGQGGRALRTLALDAIDLVTLLLGHFRRLLTRNSDIPNDKSPRPGNQSAATHGDKP